LAPRLCCTKRVATTAITAELGLGLGLGFITTDCTGYATSRLSDDSRRTLNSLRRFVCGACVCVLGRGGALPPEGGVVTSLSPTPLTRPLWASRPSSPSPSCPLSLCALPGTRASPPPLSSSWVPSSFSHCILSGGGQEAQGQADLTLYSGTRRHRRRNSQPHTGTAR
jgi:hypothetical protein